MSVIDKAFISVSINGINIDSSIPCNKGNYENKSSRDVGYFVIHYTGNDKDTAKNNATYFKNNKVETSAHFFVDDGSIYQSVELRDVAWHCGTTKGYKTGCRNGNSIGVEMCTSGGGVCSAKTRLNAAYLMAYLMKLCGFKASDVDSRVLRHYDIGNNNKSCPNQFVKNPSEFNTFRTWIKNILNTGNHNGTVAQPIGASSKAVSYTIKVSNVDKGDVLNIRQEPNASSKKTGELKWNDPNKYTIILEQNGWGKLKSGVGWINLYYTKKA